MIKDKITEQEFKKIFNLHENCKITKTTLNQYTKYIVGSYLLHHELYNIGVFENEKYWFKTILGKYKVILKPTIKHSLEYQTFVMDLGSKMAISLNFKENKKFNEKEIERFNPFWTYTIFDGDDKYKIVMQAFDEFVNKKLLKINNQFLIKYGITSPFRIIERGRSDMCIWLDGISFTTDLPYINEKGNYCTISEYYIKHSISNQSNVWAGNMLKPLKRILESVELKKY